MWTCPKCSTQNDANFCEKCGLKKGAEYNQQFDEEASYTYISDNEFFTPADKTAATDYRRLTDEHLTYGDVLKKGRLRGLISSKKHRGKDINEEMTASKADKKIAVKARKEERRKAKIAKRESKLINKDDTNLKLGVFEKGDYKAYSEPHTSATAMGYTYGYSSYSPYVTPKKSPKPKRGLLIAVIIQSVVLVAVTLFAGVFIISSQNSSDYWYNEWSRSQSDLDDLSGTVSSNQSEIDSLRSENESLSEENSELKSKNQSLKDDVEDLESEVSSLSSKLNKAQEKVDFLDNHIVVVNKNGSTRTIHKYDCSKFNHSSFWAYNTEQVINDSDYVKCSNCMY